jgi:hypothetical protein
MENLKIDSDGAVKLPTAPVAFSFVSEIKYYNARNSGMTPPSLRKQPACRQAHSKISFRTEGLPTCIQLPVSVTRKRTEAFNGNEAC